jgi:hypothetical protein
MSPNDIISHADRCSISGDMSQEMRQGNLRTLPNSERLHKTRRPIEQCNFTTRYESHHHGRCTDNLCERPEIEHGGKLQGTTFSNAVRVNLGPPAYLNRKPTVLRGNDNCTRENSL